MPIEEDEFNFSPPIELPQRSLPMSDESLVNARREALSASSRFFNEMDKAIRRANWPRELLPLNVVMKRTLNLKELPLPNTPEAVSLVTNLMFFIHSLSLRCPPSLGALVHAALESAHGPLVPSLPAEFRRTKSL